MEDKDKLPMVIGAVVAIVVGVFLLAERHHADAVPQTSTQQTKPAANSTQPDSSTPFNTASVNTAASQSPVRSVYECVIAGKRVFSDAPCGGNAQVRELSPINTMDAYRPSYRPDAPLPQPSRDGVAADVDDTPAYDCTIFENEVKLIDERMRHGYDAWQGEYLRGQRRQAAERRDDCQRRQRLR